MFKSGSEPLYDFFNKSGVAYYIPFYQRQYSWDKENVEKMMDDLYDGVRKVCKNKHYVRFIGTIILFEESGPKVGVHYDANQLITKIQNVIDGQQRISTIAVAAVLFCKRLREIQGIIQSKGWDALPSISDLMDTIENRLFLLQQFYSDEVKRTKVNPALKPIIIRAFDMTSSPSADQWTLSGSYQDFYRSDVGRFLAHFIQDGTVLSGEYITNARLRDNVAEIDKWISKTLEASNFPDAETLLKKNGPSEPLKAFIDGDIDLLALRTSFRECAELVEGAIKVLALIHFMAHRTYLTVIECPSEDLAFDMFQSLNATGTPLTAIEVFKPLVVNTLGARFGSSKTKVYFDKADQFFDSRNSAADKEKLTDDVLLRMALVYDGTELGKRFSEQRDWLVNAFQQCKLDQDHEDFIHWLSDLTEYWEYVFQPRKPKQGANSFKLVNHLSVLGMNAGDADLAALCIFYLKDANHAMAHYVLSLFYSKLVRATGGANKSVASSQFLQVCKACAAFFTLWGGALTGFPDEAYRELFRQSEKNLSWKSGVSNQTATFVKEHFKSVLVDKGAFSTGGMAAAKALWKPKALENLGYGKKKIAKFVLFVAAHDKAPDTTSGKEGLMVKGTPGSAPYLTCEKWYSKDYEVVEHISNRDKPPPPYKYGPPDSQLYPGNYSVVDKIGNLTLWSRSANSSTYPEWPDKAYYYATLTALTPTNAANLATLKTRLRISTVPPALASLAASTNYMSNLAPLALRGEAGLPLDKAFIEERTDRICDLLFEDLYNWIN